MRGPHNIWRLVRTGATLERTGAMGVVLAAMNAPPRLRLVARVLGWPFKWLGLQGDLSLPPATRALTALGPAYIKSVRAPAAYFTGTVWQDPIIETPEPAHLRAVKVSFEPGARTAWHTHPLGQTLQILSGVGLVQTWGGPVRVVRAGDVVWFEPGEKHWHGASPDVAMVHLAMQEALGGKHVDWMEQVDDTQYGVTPEG